MRIYLIILMFFPSFVFAEEGVLRVFVFKGDKVLTKGFVSIQKEDSSSEEIKRPVKEGEAVFSVPSGKYELWVKKRKKNKKIIVSVSDQAETQIVFDLKDSDYGSDKPVSVFQESRVATLDLKSEDLKKVRGVVYSKETSSPVPGALIIIKGASFQTKTDENGVFEIPMPGENKGMDLAVIHSEYSTQQIKGINSQNWEGFSQISLAPSMGELSEFIVLAPQGKGSLEALLRERKKAETVSDFIGSEQIAKTGDSNAGSALKRVTGLSLVNGKFVYIRGLGERYSSTVLNKATLPSPDPSRKVVPLDLFPTTLIESISIQKSFSVDRPAEFSAGVVEIRTKSIPDKFQAGISFSTSASSEEVLEGREQGLSHAGGGSSDLLGRDDGSRALPRLIRDTRETGKRIEPENIFDETIGFPEEDIQAFGRSFSNNYDVNSENVGPGFGMSMNIGDLYRRGVQKAGGLVKASYSVSRDHDNFVQNEYELASEEIGLLQNLQDQSAQTEERVNLGALATAGVELAKSQKINFTGVLTRSTSNTTQILDRDASFNEDTFFQITRLNWQERELGSLQLAGEHHFRENFKGPKIEWLLSRSRALRIEPDRREYFYTLVEGVPTFLSSRSFSNARQFSDLEDDAENAQLKFSFKVGGDKFSWSSFLGAAWSRKRRVSEVQRFRFTDQGFVDRDEPDTDPLSSIMRPENIVPGGFELIDATEDTDNYRASAVNQAFFFSNSLNYALSEQRSLNLYGGVRVEDHDQNVELFSIFTQEEEFDNNINLGAQDAFPVAGLNFQINKKAALRFGYSETISRPDFKELAPSNYFNDVENIIERGNANLESAYVQNYDLRYDYYLSRDEVLSVGGFAKDIENPIEITRVISTDPKRTFQNVPEATVRGFELEGRLALRRLTSYLNGVYLSANYSYIESSVDLSQTNGAETSRERPLQGQSPYLWNVGLEYENKKRGLDLALSYNVAGRRISDVGDSGAPDIYEEPFHQMDFTLRKSLSKRTSVNFKVRNLLDSTLERTQGGLPVRTFRDGRSYSLSLSARI